MAAHWKLGIEIELIAPRGLSRLSLAEVLAEQCGGSVRSFFHPQAEHGANPNVQSFQNLTQGYRVLDNRGRLVADLVDDLTLQQDCDKKAAAQAGWYRILSDDARLLSLIQQQCCADENPPDLLKPLAKLFGTELENQQDMVRVTDLKGSPVAMLAPLPGERERACELITPPISQDLGMRLNELLLPAQQLGFVNAIEAATHYHFDAGKLCSARVISRLILFFAQFESELRQKMKTNPMCQRDGGMQASLIDLANNEDFLKADWPLARQRLLDSKPSKYQDVNFLNIARADKAKHTLEIRMVGPSLAVDQLVENAVFLESILHWSMDKKTLPKQLATI